ncbi:helix-turn-helix domain-containing protein [Streptomyces sp. NPDC090109]|uniref:helix-turn-helix domain-containing protein n=1 Tax=Streptomyces sp. NPDC090109 TaxID=3365948 RepID=UPI0037FB65D9
MTIPTQLPSSSSRPRPREGARSLRGGRPLPVPEERARLRRSLGLSEGQVAEVFGVKVATVRSWESGRTSPTGERRAACAALLEGFARALDSRRPPRSAAPARALFVRPPGRPRPVLRPLPGEGVHANGRGVPAVPAAVGAPRTPTPVLTGLPVGGGADPVSPARRRRWRATAVAAGVWTGALHLLLTCPPPHPWA